MARLFVYLSSFISQILDVLYLKASIFNVDGVTVKTSSTLTLQSRVKGSDMRRHISFVNAQIVMGPVILRATQICRRRSVMGKGESIEPYN